VFAAGFLPAEILHGKKRCLSDESTLMYGFLRLSAVRTLIDDHQAGRRDNHKMLSSLVIF